MSKFCPEIVARICELIEKDSFTIPEICKCVGIAESTFHEWQSTKAEFSEAIKKARNRFADIMAVEAARSLRKLVCGYDYTETTTESTGTGDLDEKGEKILKVKKHIIRTKHIEPNTAAIIFTLTNLDPEHWKNRTTSEMTGKNGAPLIPTELGNNLRSMSDEQIADCMRNGSSK